MDALVVVVGLALSGLVGVWVVAGVLRLASRSRDAGSAPPPDGTPEGTPPVPPPPIPARAASDGPDGPRARSTLRGGRWIGVLERLAVTGCVLLGEPSGIAIVVAVKGLGRYPELRENPGASERFVIGTLASLVWAAGLGAAGRALLA